MGIIKRDTTINRVVRDGDSIKVISIAKQGPAGVSVGLDEVSIDINDLSLAEIKGFKAALNNVILQKRNDVLEFVDENEPKQFIDLELNPTVTGQAARLWWNSTEKTANLGLSDEVTLQIGQEMNLYVRNVNGSSLVNGDIVYISGATGQIPNVQKAIATNYTQSLQVIAMVTEATIANNGFGFVTTLGVVREINTNALTEGALVYLSETTAGGFQSAEPVYPNNGVAVGYCLYKHSSLGKILFFPKLMRRKFGDVTGGNYSAFNDNGVIINYGSGRTYNDLPPIPLLVQKQGAANNPTLTAFVGNIFQLTFAVNDYVFGNYELLHEYAQGTNLKPHIHIATNSVDGTDRTVNFELEYSIANAKVSAPYDETFSSAVVISKEITIPAGTASKAHIIIPFDDILGTAYKIGAYIAYRVRRIAASGTAPSANPFCLTLGFHVLQNTQGSDEIGSKTI